MLIVLAAIFGGYGAGMAYVKWKGGETGTPATAGKPWYRDQPPPPALVRAPEAPIFPDPSDEPGARPPRPYEEALPRDVYVPRTASGRRPPAETAAPEAAKPRTEPRIAPAPPGQGTRPAASAAPADTDSPPWQRFAVAVADPGERPMIAVVIDDMGVDRLRSRRAIALKGPLTVSFLTYAADLGRQTAAARAAGHELLLHLPMEPDNLAVDPGPNVLLRDIEPDELLRRLTWGLSRFEGYVGVNNHMGSRFTADRPAMTIVLRELKRRRLLFLDSRTTGRTVGPSLARRFGVPVVERNIFLDNDDDVDAVRRRLAETERLARRLGAAIAIGHPRDATLEALGTWLETVESRGFILVPVTAVIAHDRAAG